MNDRYVLDDAGQPAAVGDLIEWARWFANADRRIARDQVGDVEVSTVFLGLDHSFGTGPPVLFETMIFGGDYDSYQWRYVSRDEAERGHQAVVAALRDGRSPDAEGGDPS